MEESWETPPQRAQKRTKPRLKCNCWLLQTRINPKSMAAEEVRSQETQAAFTTSSKSGVSGAHHCLPKHLSWCESEVALPPASVPLSRGPGAAAPAASPRQAPAPSAAPPPQAWGRGASPAQEVGYHTSAQPAVVVPRATSPRVPICLRVTSSRTL